MRCGFLTLDVVNEDLAWRLALEQGVELQVFTPQDDGPDDTLDAVVVDLDSLPADARDAALADLEAGRFEVPVAVHSYHIPDRQACTLHRRGVILGRRLRPELLARLRAAVVSRWAAERTG